MAHRTFIALDLDEHARRRLTAACDAIRLVSHSSRSRSRGDAIHWVPPENFHVTLKFLGDVSDAQLADVCRVVREAAAGIGPFDFTVGGLKAVPPAGRELRMIWAEAQNPAGRLPALFASLEQALAPLGFPRESRPFASHITLARVKYTPQADALRAAVEEQGQLPGGVVRAEQVIVYTSQLTPDGSIYTPACRAWLGGEIQ